MSNQEEYYRKSIKAIKSAYIIVFLILLLGIYSLRDNQDAIVYLGIILIILETVLFLSHLKAIDGLKEAKERVRIEKENEEKRIRRALRKSKKNSQSD
jgi:hypothetical protein